ncbi:hypothetical protein KIL84_013995 [Mauremys mutica]|uniref:Uncharacterized protein n=1 Tax=Mauremys mutica TaxID=74926 RepID=A0A9D3WYP7_9SAUR|nr:hypothetical protein KIL84_013995 [Mauremys mutica]
MSQEHQRSPLSANTSTQTLGSSLPRCPSQPQPSSRFPHNCPADNPFPAEPLILNKSPSHSYLPAHNLTELFPRPSPLTLAAQSIFLIHQEYRRMCKAPLVS